MAIYANRSPSPTPNPRNSEANSAMRRSFSGNPFQRPSIHTNPRSCYGPATPANNPADFPSRNFLGKEEKENEKDYQTLKPAKARTPAVSKGTNHFMIPTISAASKINPSPRKKVLAEKNEPFRTSISLSDGISPFGSINLSDHTEDFYRKQDNGFEESQNSEAVLKTPPNPDPSLNFSHTPQLTSPKFSDSTKAFATSISPSIVPLDADPYFPPYDPKTNYLSPRPQFLHYRPNPSLRPYFQEQGSGTKNLEDTFLSDNFSDTEVSEESEPENTDKKSKDVSPIEVIIGNSEKESEDVFAVQVVSEEDEPEISESEPITTPTSSHVSNATSEKKRVVKPRFCTKTKFIPLLLVFLIACLSVSIVDSPIFDSPVYENMSIFKFYEENFNGFAKNLELWFVYSTSHVNELISTLSREDKLGSLQFSSLTYTIEDPFNDAKRFEEIYEQDEGESEFEYKDEFEYSLDQNLEKGDQNLENEEAPKFSPEQTVYQISDSEIESTTFSSSGNAFETESSTSVSEVQSTEQDDRLVSHLEIKSSKAIPSFGNTLEIGTPQIDPEYNSETPENGETKGNVPFTSDSEIDPTRVESGSENPLEMDAYTLGLEPKYEPSKPCWTLVISLLALIAAPVLIYLRNRNTNTTHQISTNKTIKSNPSPQDYSPALDLVSDLCPSELSGLDKSHSYSKGGIWGTTNEAQSQDRKQKRVLKRESLASSSEFTMSGSPSYGSFTTYERLPTKQGYGDDEVVTPVRRSSRIKKIQVTSP